MLSTRCLISLYVVFVVLQRTISVSIVPHVYSIYFQVLLGLVHVGAVDCKFDYSTRRHFFLQRRFKYTVDSVQLHKRHCLLL